MINPLHVESIFHLDDAELVGVVITREETVGPSSWISHVPSDPFGTPP